MKTLDEYLKLPYPMEIVEDQEEGGYTISFPDLPGCITCGETIEKAVDNGKEAKRLWLEAAMEEGISIPEPEQFGEIFGTVQIKDTQKPPSFPGRTF